MQKAKNLCGDNTARLVMFALTAPIGPMSRNLRGRRRNFCGVSGLPYHKSYGAFRDNSYARSGGNALHSIPTFPVQQLPCLVLS